MYQFTTTTIINSNLDSNGVTAKFAGSADQLTVTRVGTFKKDNIVSIFKNPYTAGVKEQAKVTVPAGTSGKVLRLEVIVKLEQSTNSEYANSFLWFRKPVVIEIISTGVAADNAAALVSELTKFKNSYGFSYVNATSSGADVTLVATDNNQRFESVKLTEENTSPNSIIQPEYDLVATGSVIVPGKIGFGDDEFMIKSIQIPTYENTRPFGTSLEERPILGGNYTQYTLRYSIDKDGADGIVSGFKSVTTHVFYVKSDLVTSFETELDKLSLSGGYKLSATIDDSSLSLTGPETGQITVTGAVGEVTYTSEDDDKATVSTSGVVTPVAITAEVVITVADAAGNTAAVSVKVTA